jgi:hypothetical protein
MMPNADLAPPITDRYICIVDREALSLAAVISSYLFEANSYLPLFTFPIVTAPKTDGDPQRSDIYLSNLMGSDASVFINNAWARMGGSEYVILAGLSANQRTYLSMPKGPRVIEIAGLSDVHRKLSAIAPQKQEELRCKTSDILNGLLIAQKEGKKLEIDDEAKALPLSEVPKAKKGIIVVENNGDATSVIAVNYASSVDATLLIVDALAEREVDLIPKWIQEWKENDDDAPLKRVQGMISQRIRATSFSAFEYATFFTEGLPYSLGLENSIPCSYVHLSLRPDLFVFNSIIFERIGTFHSAVVFSPVCFEDEETEWLLEFFTQSNYWPRPLIGREATLVNLDFCVQHIPYSVLHVCSHGGEVDGLEVSEEFVDRMGKTHTIEYDQVIGSHPVPNEDGLFRVHRKVLPRKLDGFAWKSEELTKENMPQYVFDDLWNALYPDQRIKPNPNAKRKKKDLIVNSCAIRCVDSIHQGEFTMLACHSSPVVFNNTCCSWGEVAKFFLACGARAYIGTLWEIDNDAAIIGARTFYENVFQGTILGAFNRAVKTIDGTQSKDIYIYWGLHFTTLSPGRTAAESRSEVLGELLQAVKGWRAQIASTTSAEGKRNATRVLNSVLHELNVTFGPEGEKG